MGCVLHILVFFCSDKRWIGFAHTLQKKRTNYIDTIGLCCPEQCMGGHKA
jgi:hypothetical protein